MTPWRPTPDACQAMIQTVILPLLLAVPAVAQICQTQVLVPPDPQSDGGVGIAVALHGDTVAAGTALVDYNTGGAVYVWRRVSQSWALEQKVQAPVNQFGYVFGRAVALSGDRMVVGGNPGLNAVWLYRRSGTVWAPVTSFLGSGFTYAIQYGHAVAVDGEWIAVGAPGATVPAPGTDRPGAVYVFRDQGTAVTEVQRLQPLLGHGDDVGWDLSMRGSILVVGSAVGNQSAASGDGRAFVYRIQNGQPVLEATLASPGATPGRDSQGATFGRAVSTDGARVAVADLGEVVGPSRSGSVNIWRHQAGTWVHEATLTSSVATCGFGQRVALDGEDLLVATQCGSHVSHFRRSGTSWIERGVTPAQPNTPFQVRALAMSGGLGALGSNLTQGTPTNAGEVRLLVPGAGSFPYGAAHAGSGGLLPRLRGNGCPVVGQPYAIELGNGLGGHLAILGVGFGAGQAALLGGMVWIAPVATTIAVVLGGAAGVPGVGTYQLPLSITSPALVGAGLYFQAGVLDPGASQSVAFSNGLQVIVGG